MILIKEQTKSLWFGGFVSLLLLSGACSIDKGREPERLFGLEERESRVYHLDSLTSIDATSLTLWEEQSDGTYYWTWTQNGGLLPFKIEIKNWINDFK